MAATAQQRKAYQTVIAGRVREDELLAFYGGNFSAFATGRFSAHRTGGHLKQPVITKNYSNEYVGKQRPVAAGATEAQIVAANGGNAIAEAYDAGSNNNGTR